MIAFILRRLLQSIMVMLTVALVAFALFRFVGDPIASMVGQETTLAERAEMREALGLNDPFVVQFATFVTRAATGDFGISYRLQQPVMELILSRLPATLELALVSGVAAFVFGVGFGVYTALNRGNWLSGTIMTASLIGVSLPISGVFQRRNHVDEMDIGSGQHGLSQDRYGGKPVSQGRIPRPGFSQG